MDAKIKTRGGSRPGAGRKKGSFRGRTTTSITVSIKKDYLEIIEAECKRLKMSRSKWITTAIGHQLF